VSRTRCSGGLAEYGEILDEQPAWIRPLACQRREPTHVASHRQPLLAAFFGGANIVPALTMSSFDRTYTSRSETFRPFGLRGVPDVRQIRNAIAGVFTERAWLMRALHLSSTTRSGAHIHHPIRVRRVQCLPLRRHNHRHAELLNRCGNSLVLSSFARRLCGDERGIARLHGRVAIRLRSRLLGHCKYAGS
jgi:hypothetical protein